MKSQINPVVAIVVVVLVVAVVGFFLMRKTSTDSGYAAPEHETTKASKANK